ncbi:MAG: hypothetical protein ACR2MM_03985 [Flavobacteriaceae bacterium]
MNDKYLPISQQKLEKLAKFNEQYCVSMYIPMYKSGKEQNQGLSQAHLKSCTKIAHQNLLAQGMDKSEAQQYLEPISELQTNVQLWRNPSDGLAIFLDKQNGLTYHRIPSKFEPTTYVSDHFYLVPLLPLLEFDTTFYLLELSQDHVKLYHGSKFGIEDLFVNDFAPETLEEVVGSDFEQKMLQFHTGHSMYSAGSFHGKGEGKDDERKEISQFFREINKGVLKAIKNRHAPLVLACVDWLYPIYKEANTYPHLYPDHLSGDPEYTTKSKMQQEAWELITSIYQKKKKQKTVLFGELIHTQRTCHQISEIVPAAKQGKIETLFLSKGDEVYGSYNGTNNCVILDTEKAAFNFSLINRAALNTILQGGKVFTMEPEDMPVKKRPLNAIYRY